MESFKINSLFHSYCSILFKNKKQWCTRRVILNGLLPFAVAFFLLFTVEVLNEIKDSIFLILSILVGLLFNFVSSFSDRINSVHLSQNASQKIIRLELIRETSDGAFVTILLSLACLAILLFLTFISNSILLQISSIKKVFTILLGSFSLTILGQIGLMLVYMINRLRKLVKVDTFQEKQYLEEMQEKELNDWEDYD